MGRLGGPQGKLSSGSLDRQMLFDINRHFPDAEILLEPSFHFLYSFPPTNAI
jgi:hypothetical protein